MPLIGITPDSATKPPASPGRKAEPFIFLQERYIRAITDAGAIPLVLPATLSGRAIEKLLDRLDGIVVSGGAFDIHPRCYGEEAIAGLGSVKDERTEFELELIDLALRRDLAILGICGGAQAINIALGGTLYQDIGSQIPGATEHEKGALKEKGGHQIKICDGTKLRQIVKRDTIEVNTTHHQSVKKLGKGLIVNATAEDGVIEGIESQNDSFVLGVQWHPEFLLDRDPCQRKIFTAFVLACRTAR